MNTQDTWRFKTTKAIQVFSLLMVALAFTACGGGGGSSGGGSSSGGSSSSSGGSSSSSGGSSSGSSSGGGPTSTNFLSAEAQPGGSATRPKTLKLTWEVDSQPDHYRVEINADGASGFVDSELGDIAGDAAEFEFEVPLHLTSWDSAQLQLVALDGAEEELGRSDIIPLDQVDIDEMIGYFKGPTVEAKMKFGVSSALSNDGSTLAISALELDFYGAVYVYSKDAGEWRFQKKLVPEAPDSFDEFAHRSLAISANGNTLAVGAAGEDSDATGIDGDASTNIDSNFNAGAAYVFKRDSDGNWAQQAYIKGSNTGEDDQFGSGVALSTDGSQLAVGAPGEDSDGDPSNDNTQDSGALYIFNEDEAGWAQQSYIKGGDVTDSRRLGSSVALSANGNTLAAGAARLYGPEGLYVFAFDSESDDWEPQAENIAENDSDGLGSTIALSDDGNTLAAGAPSHDVAAEDAGAAFVYQRDGESWIQQARLIASTPDSDDLFGWVSLSGDGKTLAVGAPQEGSDSTGLNGDGSNNNAEYSGAVYVYQLESEWQQKLYLKAPNTEELDVFGISATLSFDGNSLFVSAPAEDSVAIEIGGDWEDNNGTNTGAVFLY